MARKSLAGLIFVVDDRFEIAQRVAKALREAGYDALPFCSQYDALWAATSQEPDLLITDLNMPAIDGYTLAGRLTEHYPSCRVLVMSADPILTNAHPRRSGFELIPKPLRSDVLLDYVKEAMRKDNGIGAN